VAVALGDDEVGVVQQPIGCRCGEGGGRPDRRAASPVVDDAGTLAHRRLQDPDGPRSRRQAELQPIADEAGQRLEAAMQPVCEPGPQSRPAALSVVLNGSRRRWDGRAGRPQRPDPVLTDPGPELGIAVLPCAAVSHARLPTARGPEGPDERGLLRRPRWPSASAWPTCAGQDE